MLRLIALAAFVAATVVAWRWSAPAAEVTAPCMRFCVDCPPFCSGAYVPPGE